jgi:hypothetical protein
VSEAQSSGDQRPCAVPDTLDELAGPAGGPISLPPELGRTGRTDYDLDDAADTAVFYERVLVGATRAQDVNRLVNGDRLRTLWSRIFLPAGVRERWESRFPSLNPAA